MKRFSETTRFEEEWYIDLTVEFKIAWEYVWARCDNSGVWVPNFKLAQFQIGAKVKWSDFLLAVGDRIQVIDGGKWWISAFVECQCGKLSRECRPHLKVIELLQKHGIEECEGGGLAVRGAKHHGVTAARRARVFLRDNYTCVYCLKVGIEPEDLQPDHVIPKTKGGSNDVSNLVTACVACNALKSDRELHDFLRENPDSDRVLEYLDSLSGIEDTPKDKDKDKYKDGGRGAGEGGRKTPEPPERPSREEFDAYVIQHLGMDQNDSDHVWSAWEENGWTRSQAGKRVPISKWRIALNTWKTGRYFPSQKTSKPSATNGKHSRPSVPRIPDDAEW